MPPNTTLSAPALKALLEKMRSSDPDFQCIAMIDLQKQIDQRLIIFDEAAEQEIYRSLVGLFGEGSGEVRQMSVNAIIKVTSITQHRNTVNYMVSELIKLSFGDREDSVQDLGPVALRGVLEAIPSHHKAINEVVSKAWGAIIAAAGSPKAKTPFVTELVEVLSLIFNRFPNLVAANSAYQQASLDLLTGLLESPRLLARKRVIACLCHLVTISSNALVDKLLQRTLAGLSAKDLDADDAMDESPKYAASYALLVAGLATSCPSKVQRHMTRFIEMIVGLSGNAANDELVEATMTTLETFILKCPTEVTPFLNQIQRRSLELLQYDPNYAGFDGVEDEDMADDLDDEFDDEFEAYSDDEDTSWKARRAAAKTLQALIMSRPELQRQFLVEVAPTLTKRLSEREESVRVEVFGAWESLLRTASPVHGPSEAPLTLGMKRKRAFSGEDDDSNPLISQVQNLSHAVIKQSLTKSPVTKERAFRLLRALVIAVGGGLETQVDAVADSAQKALMAGSSTTTGSTLAVAVLEFLGAFFRNHDSKVYIPHLGTLTPYVTAAVQDRYQKVAIAGLHAASDMAAALNAAPQSVQSLYDAVQSVISSTSSDADIRQEGLRTLGELLRYEGGLANVSTFDLILGRLSQESTQTVAAQIVGVAAASETCQGRDFEAFLAKSLDVLPALFRKSHRLTRTTSLESTTKVLRRMPNTPSKSLANEVRPLLRDSDLHTLASVLQILSSVITHADDMQGDILPLTTSPNLHGIALDSLVNLLQSYPKHHDSARLVEGIMERALTEVGDSQAASIASNAAKCIATIIISAEDTTLLGRFVEAIKSPKSQWQQKYLSLLVLGDVGRSCDMSKYDIFDAVLAGFDSKREEEKSAAAFCAGNIAVGGPDQYLSALIEGFKNSQQSKSVLYLHAVRETITHCSAMRTEAISNALWKPLLDKTEDDGARNIKSACLGKIICSNPRKYLPELHAQLSAAPGVLLIILAALRYVLIEPSQAADESLASTIADYLELIKHQDFLVRRLAVSALNAAAQHKLHLVQDHIPAFLPSLYNETEKKRELVRVVKMGPFSVETDDGIPNRRQAYETLHTLLSTSFSRLEIQGLLARVAASLNDVDEIRMNGFACIDKLAELAPQQLAAILEDLAPGVQETMKDAQTKDATAQDVARKEELQHLALRTLIPIWRNLATPGGKFDAEMRALSRSEKWASQFT